MIDKEQIKDLMRNCSEGQFERLERNSIKDISFYSFRQLENRSVKNYRVGVKYKEDVLAAEFIFLSEEDEESCFFNAQGTFCFWSTPELCEYYLNKYSFLCEKISEPYSSIKIHEIYNREGYLVLYWYE